jgi:hypothetical protein
MSPAGSATPGHGFWVQPFGEGRSGFIQPSAVGSLTVGSLADPWPHHVVTVFLGG